jgi:hypothetical protein
LVTITTTASGATSSSGGRTVRAYRDALGGEVEARLAELWVAADRHDNYVRGAADLDVVRADDGCHRDEPEPMLQIEHLGPDLVGVAAHSVMVLPVPRIRQAYASVTPT